MTEASTINLQEHFNSLNGGVSMWLSRFSDLLVVHELDEFYRAAHEVSNHSPEMALRDHWHFFRLGIEGLGNERLKSLIASLKEPFALIGRLYEEHQRCAESIEKVEELWNIAAEKTKQQLDVWEPWAVETEIRRRKRSFPFAYNSDFDLQLRFNVSLELSGAIAEIESPQRLQKNLAFFETRIKGIKATISNAYLDEDLPAESSVYTFDMTLNNLMKHQMQVNELANRMAEITEKRKCAEDTYQTKKVPLTILLGELPSTAQWALFRICRPDLRELGIYPLDWAGNASADELIVPD